MCSGVRESPAKHSEDRGCDLLVEASESVCIYTCTQVRSINHQLIINYIGMDKRQLGITYKQFTQSRLE